MNFNFFKKHKELRWNKILQSYWKTLTVTFLIPFLLINILVFIYYRHILVNQTISNQLTTLYQKQTVLDKAAYDAEIIYSQLSQNDTVSDFFDFNDISQAHDYYFRELERVIKTTTVLSSSLDSIYIYNESADYVFTTRTPGKIANFPDNSWYSTYKENNGSFVQSRILDNNLIVTYCFETYTNSGNNGIIVINFNLIDVFSSSVSETHHTVCLADIEKNVFKRADDFIVNYETDFVHLFENSSLKSESNVNFNSAGTYLKSTGGIFTLFIENESIFAGNEYFTLIMLTIGIVLIALLISFILAYILSSKLYNYIANIVLSMDAAGNNEEKDVLRDVIEQIATNSLNSHELESELAEKVSLLRQSQTIALQTQITPHFLYNTLQAINFTTLKLCKGDNDASRMIVLFSDLLHAALDTKGYLVSLETEIEYVKQYLKIQQYKYGDKFSFTLDLADGTLNLTVIKLMLQPVIENAIHHGILPTKRKCRIILSTMVTSEKFIIKVSNDGVPVKPEKVLQLNSILENPKEISQSRHIGLSNVNQRIKLIFGNDYGCRIHSTESLTTVTIALPLTK
ncbi:MAG: histidine kinase [Clostridia bacterium]|nr:histidine kinase [Clostridia bacterium]